MYNHDNLYYNPVQMDIDLLRDERFDVLTERRFSDNSSTVLVTLFKDGKKVETLAEDCHCDLESEQRCEIQLKEDLLREYGQ